MNIEEAIKEVENYLDYEGSISITAIATLYTAYEKEKEKNESLIKERAAEIVYVDKNFIRKDKIKAKIEEYKKQIEELKNSQIFTRTEYEGAIKFGQSLLEEE